MELVNKQEASGGVCVLTSEPAATASGRYTARALRLILVLLVLNPLGNLFLAWGLKHDAATLAANPLAYMIVIVHPFAALGIGLLTLAFLTRMVLFSVADLSYMLPITAIGYIIAAVYGMVFLQEQISSERWLGIALIFSGIALVGTTTARTTGDFPETPALKESI